MSWSGVINEKIAEAIKEGELVQSEELQGKPLNLDAYFATPHEIRMGYSVLANSGFTPLEIDIRKELNQINERISRTNDEDILTELSRRASQLQVQLDLKR